MIEILEGRGNVLALAGHQHQVGRNFLQGQDVCVHELVTGLLVVSGGWEKRLGKVFRLL